MASELNLAEALAIVSAANAALRIDELRGKHVACWCRLDQPCHADALLERGIAERPN